MRVYLDTGIFIDYLSQSATAGTSLRQAPRRGRNPQQIHQEAADVLNRISAAHAGATSTLTCYEVEEALYGQIQLATKGVANVDALRIQAARSILGQTVLALRFFGIEALPLSIQIVGDQIQNLQLQLAGIRAADALHIATAVAFDAELFISGDKHLLRLDQQLMNASGTPIRFCDTDAALTFL